MRPTTSAFSPSKSTSRPNTSLTSLSKKSASTGQLMDLPNLPGVKKDLSAINPKLYKEFKSSSVSLDESSIAASLGSRIPENTSLEDFFADPSKYELVQKSLNPYPVCGVAYNDVYGGRYSITAQKKRYFN